MLIELDGSTSREVLEGNVYDFEELINIEDRLVPTVFEEVSIIGSGYGGSSCIGELMSFGDVLSQ